MSKAQAKLAFGALLFAWWGTVFAFAAANPPYDASPPIVLTRWLFATTAWVAAALCLIDYAKAPLQPPSPTETPGDQP